LSSIVPVAYVDVRTLAHATEDPDKVEKALLNTLSAIKADTIVVRRSSLAGHHGNPIILFETRVKDKEVVKKTFQRLSSGLSMMDKEFLGSEIRRHLERGNLYLRLDKQSAYMNRLRLCDVDPIHMKVHFKKSDAEDVIRICREAGLIP
jgi:RNA binding exosome subunit